MSRPAHIVRIVRTFGAGVLMAALGACLSTSEEDDSEPDPVSDAFCDAHRAYLERCGAEGGRPSSCVTSAVNGCTTYASTTGELYEVEVADALADASCTDQGFDDARNPNLLDSQPTAGHQRVATRFCDACRPDPPFDCLESFYSSDSQLAAAAGLILPLDDRVALRVEQQCAPTEIGAQCDSLFLDCIVDFWRTEMPFVLCADP